MQNIVATRGYIVKSIPARAVRVRRTVGLFDLPMLQVADHSEILHLLHEYQLYGTGLGWIDLHLLAAARIANDPFWTMEKRLAAAAHVLTIESPVN